MPKFDSCPNCKHRPYSMFGGTWMYIYECKKCGKLYCHECGGEKCPKCGSKERKEAGKCWQK